MVNFVKSNPIKTIFIVIILTGVISFSVVYHVFFASGQTTEYCDSEGKMYKELRDNYAEWLEHFEQGGASFEIQLIEPPSAVFMTRTPNGTDILIVEVDRGTGLRRIQGQSGYFFTPNGELPNFFSVYGHNRQKFEVEALGENIYCYRMD